MIEMMEMENVKAGKHKRISLITLTAVILLDKNAPKLRAKTSCESKHRKYHFNEKAY